MAGSVGKAGRASALLVSALACLCAAQQSTVFELDLVFPRNETYKPVYPFPVVLTFQNPAVVWPYAFSYELNFRPLPLTEEGGFSEMWPSRTPGYTESTYQGEDPLTHIYLNSDIVNSTSKHWILGWHVFLTYNCTPSEREDELPRYSNRSDGAFTHVTGAVHFTIDEDTGKLPQIDDGEAACPKTAWTVDIIGEASNDHEGAPTIDPLTCPYFNPDDPHPAGDPCAVRPTEKLAQNVTDYILSRMQCVGLENWPNTSYTAPCWDDDWEESGGSPRHGGLFQIGILALLCLATTAGYFWMG